MADIFHFVAQYKLEAQQNTEIFISRCKSELTVFGPDLNWDDWKWPGAANFTKLGVHNQTKDDRDQFNKEFIDFAKAYFRYQQGHKPTGTKNEMKALRAVEASLIQLTGNAFVQDISISVLDEAAQMICRHYSAGAAYHGGRELERLAKFVSINSLVNADLDSWKSPLSRKKDDIQTGEVARTRRERKLPSPEALEALAEIFANCPTDPKDIFTSSVFAMLMSAPSRISEVLELPVDCEVEDKDSNGTDRYGWRFYSGKGFGGDIKWIPTEMVSIAKEAISRIRQLTEDSRRLAQWLENTPGRFYRHSSCPDVPDTQPLSALDVCRALGLSAVNRANAQSTLSMMGLDNRDGIYSLSELCKYVSSRQPSGFPWVNRAKKLKYSNALFCMSRNLIHGRKGTSPVINWFPTNNVFNNDLSPRESLQRETHKSIFDRNNYLGSHGQRLKLTSHQARHLLNTMAQRGGLSQHEIAKWSGRADLKQNRVYNHVSEYEMVARSEELDKSLTLFGPAGVVEMRMPITIQEFNTLERGPVHVTEFGVCVHDFTMSPCDKFRDCLNCQEQVCIKGDNEKLVRTKKRFGEVKKQVEAAELAMKLGEAGADRWYEYHCNTLERLRQLIFILENPDIDDGAQIKLKNNNAFSPLRRAITSKLESISEENEVALLNDMNNLLGGGLG